MLFNEPKLLKIIVRRLPDHHILRFSALQRAEIAEKKPGRWLVRDGRRFSALQRAEIAENEATLTFIQSAFRFSALQRAEIAENGVRVGDGDGEGEGFSALQRAEIAENQQLARIRNPFEVSVLFNEPKLLKTRNPRPTATIVNCFSALQRAEIAENPDRPADDLIPTTRFQCSSTSRNC